ncbi:PREDICTED: pre T-cell antigen receptor alpha [Condylura cristata]|uniref:pre T-cell antigen receptor alpha n=1 Tax=Condylura cristata TaxID=143302 RepID=UPI0003346A91|nr:PREDICTED: pre T-cell antigen receptor alpha [Condylura cristata]
MVQVWLLLLLALGCPALPTGLGDTPFPSLAPPITLLVDGKQQMLVVCLVLNIAAPGLESPIWFSAGNGSALEAFTYGPSPAADGTWTRLAQLSMPCEELAAWEKLVCHTGPRNLSWSTQPLQLSGKASSARTCLWESLRGTRGQVLQLGALRLLLFKLLLVDVLLTCSRLRAMPAAAGVDPAGAPGPRARGLPAPCTATRPGCPLHPQARRGRGLSAAPSHRPLLCDGETAERDLARWVPTSLQMAAGITPAFRVGARGAHSERRGAAGAPARRARQALGFRPQALEHFSDRPLAPEKELPQRCLPRRQTSF